MSSTGKYSGPRSPLDAQQLATKDRFARKQEPRQRKAAPGEQSTNLAPAPRMTHIDDPERPMEPQLSNGSSKYSDDSDYLQPTVYSPPPKQVPRAATAAAITQPVDKSLRRKALASSRSPSISPELQTETSRTARQAPVPSPSPVSSPSPIRMRSSVDVERTVEDYQDGESMTDIESHAGSSIDLDNPEQVNVFIEEYRVASKWARRIDAWTGAASPVAMLVTGIGVASAAGGGIGFLGALAGWAAVSLLGAFVQNAIKKKVAKQFPGGLDALRDIAQNPDDNFADAAYKAKKLIALQERGLGATIGRSLISPLRLIGKGFFKARDWFRAQGGDAQPAASTRTGMAQPRPRRSELSRHARHGADGRESSGNSEVIDRLSQEAERYQEPEHDVEFDEHGRERPQSFNEDALPPHTWTDTIREEPEIEAEQAAVGQPMDSRFHPLFKGKDIGAEMDEEINDAIGDEARKITLENVKLLQPDVEDAGQNDEATRTKRKTHNRNVSFAPQLEEEAQRFVEDARRLEEGGSYFDEDEASFEEGGSYFEEDVSRLDASGSYFDQDVSHFAAEALRSGGLPINIEVLEQPVVAMPTLEAPPSLPQKSPARNLRDLIAPDAELDQAAFERMQENLATEFLKQVPESSQDIRSRKAYAAYVSPDVMSEKDADAAVQQMAARPRLARESRPMSDDGLLKLRLSTHLLGKSPLGTPRVGTPNPDLNPEAGLTNLARLMPPSATLERPSVRNSKVKYRATPVSLEPLTNVVEPKLDPALETPSVPTSDLPRLRDAGGTMTRFLNQVFGQDKQVSDTPFSAAFTEMSNKANDYSNVLTSLRPNEVNAVRQMRPVTKVLKATREWAHDLEVAFAAYANGSNGSIQLRDAALNATLGGIASGMMKQLHTTGELLIPGTVTGVRTGEEISQPMMYHIKRAQDGTLDVTVYNAGYGVDTHHARALTGGFDPSYTRTGIKGIDVSAVMDLLSLGAKHGHRQDDSTHSLSPRVRSAYRLVNGLGGEQVKAYSNAEPVESDERINSAWKLIDAFVSNQVEARSGDQFRAYAQSRVFVEAQRKLDIKDGDLDAAAQNPDAVKDPGELGALIRANDVWKATYDKIADYAPPMSARAYAKANAIRTRK